MNRETPDMFEKILRFLAERRLDKDAEAFAANQLKDSAIEAKYADFERRVPISVFMKELCSDFDIQDNASVFEPEETHGLYALLQSALDINSLENFHRNFPGTSDAIKRQCAKLAGFARRCCRSVVLVPDSSFFEPVYLDADMDKSDNTPEKDPPVRKTSLQDTGYAIPCIRMNQNGVYVIPFDAVNRFIGYLSLDEHMLRIAFQNMPEPRPEFRIFLNGFEETSCLSSKWMAKDEVVVVQLFDYPELTHLTYTPYSGQDTITIIIWNSVEKRLIDAILAGLIDNTRDRLEWWYRPVGELDNQSPWQCLKNRKERLVIQYLASQIPGSGTDTSE